MEYSLFNLQRFKTGISAPIAEKEISNLVTVRTIKRRDVLPEEAMGFSILRSVWRNISRE